MLLVCVSSITILLYSSTHTVIIIISIVCERLYLSYYHYCHIIVIKSIFYASSATSTTQIVIRYYSFAATPVVRKNIHCGWVSEAYTETRWSKTRRRRNKLKYCLLVRWRTIRYRKKEGTRKTDKSTAEAVRNIKQKLYRQEMLTVVVVLCFSGLKWRYDNGGGVFSVRGITEYTQTPELCEFWALLFSPFYSPSTSLDRSLPLLLLRSLDTGKNFSAKLAPPAKRRSVKSQVKQALVVEGRKENLGEEKAAVANSIKL